MLAELDTLLTNEPERDVVAALLDRAARGQVLHGQEIFITDNGFAGEEFERFHP